MFAYYLKQNILDTFMNTEESMPFPESIEIAALEKI